MNQLILGIFLFSLSFTSFAFDIIAHRGVHHTYDRTNLERDTCTADRIFQPEHSYFENTLASMKLAFELGADWVELDIHPTTDGHFAVFHDWTLDCRTEGKGVTRTHSLAYLKTLDIGYGYTADGGKSYPLRGKGVGLIPSLSEVLLAFPDKKLLINVKGRDKEAADALGNLLSRLPASQRRNLAVYGGSQENLQRVSELSGVSTWLSKSIIWQCYQEILQSKGESLGQCHGQIFGGPLALAEKIPGWPEQFISRVKDSGGTFYVMGVDSEDDVKRLGPHYQGGIWTDKIEVIGPLLADAESVLY